MKRLIFVGVGLGAFIGLGFYMNQSKRPTIPAAEPVAESTPDPTIEQPPPLKKVSAAPDRSRTDPADPGSLAPPVTIAAGQEPARVVLTPTAATDAQWLFKQAIETLVSGQIGFEEKQATWKRLKDTGQLDQAIRELEQRAANDPSSAENVAALGQAYLKKCALLQDVREQAILAMQADQTLETALSLDPSNWEARYTKAVGMSYWPAQLNKGQEVFEQLQTLIQQQEAQPARPHFARSYLRLGDQYRKAGQPDYAVQVWQRGAAFFPNDEELKSKLASAP